MANILVRIKGDPGRKKLKKKEGRKRAFLSRESIYRVHRRSLRFQNEMNIHLERGFPTNERRSAAFRGLAVDDATGGKIEKEEVIPSLQISL